MFTAIRNAVGNPESTRMRRGISSTMWHEDSVGWIRSSLSGRLQRRTNLSRSFTIILVSNIVVVETADHPTGRESVAHARRYFKFTPG